MKRGFSGFVLVCLVANAWAAIKARIADGSDRLAQRKGWNVSKKRRSDDPRSMKSSGEVPLPKGPRLAGRLLEAMPYQLDLDKLVEENGQRNRTDFETRRRELVGQLGSVHEFVA